jgi:NTP pyrophosphatase (non-canonical NTP hydrolase)
MTNQVNFSEYSKFVDAVTSDESKDFLAFTDRLAKLDQDGANIERLLTGAVGLSAEAGEILEIVKKMIFQGKPWNKENKEHLKRELGDVLWYFTQILLALETTMEETAQTNVDKLSKRFPNGQFEIFYSENREEDDL